MKELDEFISAIDGTEAATQLKAIAEYYDSITDDFVPFCNEFGIHCAEGCGHCCEHFVPDLTPSEALIIAAYCLAAKQDVDIRKLVEENMDNTTGPCPFYRADSPYHCTIYPVRSLTCRLFGSCTSMTKHGRAFRRCSFTPNPELMPERLTEAELSEAESHVPVMNSYGAELLNLEGNSGDTALLPEALLRQTARLELLLSLTGQNLAS